MSADSNNYKDLVKSFQQLFNSSEVTWINSYPPELEQEKLNVVFSIHEYNNLMDMKNGELIESEIFKMKKNDKIQWFLQVYPNGCKEEYKGCLSLFLKLRSAEINTSIKTDYRLGIFNSSGDHYFKIGASTFKENTRGGWYNFIKNQELKENANLLSNNILTIFCSIDISTCTEPNLRISKTVNLEEVSEEVSQNFIPQNYLKIMFKDKTLSDINLIVEDKVLKAHKCVLAAASPTFSRMFKKDQNEKDKDSLPISNLTFDLLNQVLQFIYTGKVEFGSSVDTKLITAAHIYEIPELKKICEEFLIKNIALMFVCF